MKSGRGLFMLLVLALAVASPVPAQEQVTPAPAGTGEIIIFNDSGKTLIPSNQKVTDNGKACASLARQTYVKVTVPAGAHRLRPDPYLWKQEVDLAVEPGTTHYVVVAYKPERSWALPAAGAPLILKEISEAEAALLLREMKAQ